MPPAFAEHGAYMKQYQRTVELLIAKNQERLALYRVHLEQARAASLRFPDNRTFEHRLITCEELVETTARQIEVLSERLTRWRATSRR